jgi:protein-S-isoprenylcysteine O-methyltransferase Ste14
MMRRIPPVLRELLGLFVDDAHFVLAVLAWLAVFALLLPQVPLPLSWCGILLFAGLAVILVWHCLRQVAHWASRTSRDSKP